MSLVVTTLNFSLTDLKVHYYEALRPQYTAD
jgi:hypothetical protein